MSESDDYTTGSGEPAPAPEAPRSGGSGASNGTPRQQYHPDQRFDPRHKSPALAAVLSVVPGLGQIYIGYYVRGFVIAAILLIVILVAAESRDPVGPMLVMFAMFFWAFNLIDAGRMAALYNHFTAGADTIQMPEDFKLPRMGGSIIGGVVLLAFGSIALSNTAFGYRLDWLEDWWPVFPLALGAYLLARGVMDHMAQNQTPAASYDLAGDSSSLDD